MTERRPSAFRFRLADHIIGGPHDAPRWAEAPRLRAKADLPEGSGTSVAVLDSGISRHPWLSGSYAEPLPLRDSDLWDLSSAALPRHIGHGTFVSGVVLQYAPQATILPRRVVDISGHSDDAVLAAVINGLREQDPDVLNLSLVPEVEQGTLDEGTSQTRAAVQALQDECGTVVVVAAGNDGGRFPTEHLAPDSELTVVVGALDLSGRPAWFSNRDFVRIWAPGVDVVSSFVHWNGLLAATTEAEPGHPHPSTNGHGQHPAADPIRPAAPFAGWARWNGTSFATPAVAGAIAAAISSLSTIPDTRQRRLAGLCQVLDTAHDLDLNGEKSSVLAVPPVALEGSARDRVEAHPSWR